MRRLLKRLLLVVGLAAIISTALLVPLTYTALTRVVSDCGPASAFTPADFAQAGVDTGPYLMPDYETVSVASRAAGIDLSAFYIPAADQPAPTVIIVHGVSACKRAPNALLPAGMLHRAGFHVLVIDLRDHGDSTLEDGLHAAATEEYLDVLGAWDWLVSVKGMLPEQIGIFGYSLGGAAVILAAAEEPRLAALWTDSAFADVELMIDDIIADAPVLAWLKPLSLWYGRIVVGDDLLSRKPVAALASLYDRPLFIVHGAADSVVPVQHAGLLADGYPGAEVWITEGSDHVESMFNYTADYEQRLVAFFTQHLES